MFKIKFFFSEFTNAGSDVPQGSISVPPFCTFLNAIDIDLANYEGDTTIYAYVLENENVTKLLEKKIDKLFDWFADNFLNANPDKCFLLMNTDENVTLKFKNETIINICNQKLLGIVFDGKFDLDEHFTS